MKRVIHRGSLQHRRVDYLQSGTKKATKRRPFNSLIVKKLTSILYPRLMLAIPNLLDRPEHGSLLLQVSSDSSKVYVSTLI